MLSSSIFSSLLTPLVSFFFLSVCLVYSSQKKNVCAINFIKLYIKFYVFPLVLLGMKVFEKILCAIKKIDCAQKMALEFRMRKDLK